MNSLYIEMRKLRTRKLSIEQISKKLKDPRISTRALDELAEENMVGELFNTDKITSMKLADSFLNYLYFRAVSIINSNRDGEIYISTKGLKSVTLLRNILSILLTEWDPMAVYVNPSNYDRFVKPDERTSDAYMVEIDLRCRKAMNILCLLFERGINKWYLT